MVRRLVKIAVAAAALAVVLAYLRRRAAGSPGHIPRTISGRVPRPSPAADDLTTVKGIGPVYAERLAEAGIRTFAQLASEDPTDLAGRIEAGVGVDVAGWIDQARSLANGHSPGS